MKKRLSLRWRLTLITSFLLTLTCALITAFGFYNAQTNVVDTIAAAMITTPASYATQVEVVEQNPTAAMELYATLAPQSPFSLYSFLFMGLAIIAGSAGMFALSGLALKPAKQLAEEMSRVDSDSLSFRIEDFRGGDELQSISHSFNHMMERLESAFLRESRFSAAAAHELKTPLTVIRTNLDVLALDDAPTPEDCAASIAVVKKQIARMGTLVEQLALLSGTGQFERREKVNLKKLLDEILAEQIPGDCTLHSDISPVTVFGNSVMLKQACANLVQNAIRYNCAGGEVFLTLSQKENSCTFTVKDTGIGIGKEDAAHIFEPFYRAEKSRSRALGGSGLGLAIVKEITEGHGGTVTYRPNQPKGSVFEIKLPSLATV